MDEVLQATTVFGNVGKGILAKDKDLQAAFGKTDHHAICLEILAKGELQVCNCWALGRYSIAMYGCTFACMDVGL